MKFPIKAGGFLLMISVISSLAPPPAKAQSGELSDADRKAIESVVDAYVEGWLEDDPAAILNLLDGQAVLMPAGMSPIQGKENIERFWWPDDGSSTTITEYTMTVKEIGGNDNLAYSRSTAELKFVYEKDGQRTEQTNRTMSLTIFQRDPESGWKILRRMWGPWNPK